MRKQARQYVTKNNELRVPWRSYLIFFLFLLSIAPRIIFQSRGMYLFMSPPLKVRRREL